MKKQLVRSLFMVGMLVLLVAAAVSHTSGSQPISPDRAEPGSQAVNLNGRLVQNKIYAGGDRTVSLVLTLTATDSLPAERKKVQTADLVVVLDRSGSMEGQKIHFAKEAILRLMDRLTPRDRIALISYSDRVRRHTPLLPVTEGNRSFIETEIGSIMAGGSTNLGSGLQEGIDLITQTASTGNLGRLILISDGLANRGVTDTRSLGRMADVAIQGEFAVTTVGVGQDFNEYLLTTIADHGGGNYYFLENPRAFANVFQKELTDTITAAASSLEIRIPLENGWSLVNAAGFPIETSKGFALFHPGSLRIGQTRKLFLTLTLPENARESQFLKGISLSYIHNGKSREMLLDQSFQVEVVKDPREATASIDKEEWEQKVLQEDYNRLLEEVARDIKEGKEGVALDRIRAYDATVQSVNASVGSAAVQQNLEEDLDNLRGTVRESFQGSAEERQLKQKARSKTIQFEGYRKRRAKGLD